MAWLEGEAGFWDGGRVFVSHKGKRTYHVRKSVGGVLHEFSTRCSKLGPAMKAYEKWQADNSWRPGFEYANRVLLTDTSPGQRRTALLRRTGSARRGSIWNGGATYSPAATCERSPFGCYRTPWRA
jgi:hypothetical protein